jgi:GTP cyclohydrolase I
MKKAKKPGKRKEGSVSRSRSAASRSPSSTPLAEHDSLQALETNAHEMLKLLGENPEREGLVRTPHRHARALQFLTSGYQSDFKKLVGGALFEAESSELVLVRDIELYSLCEHHLLPFFGKAHVAYIPNRKIIGLSKIPRIVDAYARRLQVQERLTSQVADHLVEILDPLGVAVILESVHLCMMMRGVEKQNSTTLTSAMRGVFRDDARSRHELLTLIGGLGGGGRR